MNEELQHETHVVLADAGRVSTWILWYFKQGFITILTLPLFIILVLFFVISIFGAFLQGLAFLTASYAVYGFFVAFLVLSFGWIPVFLPPILYYSLIKNLPGLWLRPDATRMNKVFTTLAVLIILPIIAGLIYKGTALGIGWIADQDSCAAIAAGVTGSMPPVNCQ